MKKQVMLILVLLLIIPSAAALGIAPSSREILLDTQTQEFPLRIINTNNKDYELTLEVQGDLKEYITLSRKQVHLAEGTESETIRVSVNIPDSEELEEGEYNARILIRQEARAGEDVSALMGLSFRLTMIVPYTDAFLYTTLFAPNIEKGKAGNFIVQTENKGSANAIGVTPVIDIYTSAYEKVATLVGERRTVPAGQSVNFAMPLNTDLPNGRYLARATVIYEERISSDEKTFTIGTPEISIDSISTTDFRLGGIAGFNILISSNWGETISNVYADVEFTQDDNLLERTRTASTNIEGLGRAILNAYWDTTGLGIGNYEMTITINYLDKTLTKKYDVVLEQDRVRVAGVGQVIAPGEDDIFGGAGVLIIIVLMLVILNAVLIYNFVLKKRKS